MTPKAKAFTTLLCRCYVLRTSEIISNDQFLTLLAQTEGDACGDINLECGNIKKNI